MASAFETFDLGRAIATAEGIKQMRRQSTFDTLREQALRANIAQGEQAGQLAQAQEQRAAKQFNQEQQIAGTRLLNAATAEIAKDPSRISFWQPRLAEVGVEIGDFSARSPQEIQAGAAKLFESTSAALAALNPKQVQPEDVVQTVGPDGQPVFTKKSQAPGQRAYVKPDKPDAPRSNFRALTPQEIRDRGLPAGTSAQVDETTGKVDVLNKREGLSAAEQKTIREAKMRMPRVNAAVRRLDRVGEAVETIAKGMFTDGGPIDAKYLQYTKPGRELLAATQQLLPELTALTRVPGIGTQSDLETRLANLALPSLEMPPDVNRRSLAELKTFMQDLKAAYESVAASGQEEEEAEEQDGAASGEWQIEEVQ